MSKKQLSETKCPICAGSNNCQAHSQESCWCNRVTIPEELLALVPEQYQGKACICQDCLKNMKKYYVLKIELVPKHISIDQ